MSEPSSRFLINGFSKTPGGGIVQPQLWRYVASSNPILSLVECVILANFLIALCLIFLLKIITNNELYHPGLF